MLTGLKNWWSGEMVEVEIVECRNRYNDWNYQHTLVSLADRTRRYVHGHLGTPGEKIMVNTWDLKKYALL